MKALILNGKPSLAEEQDIDLTQLYEDCFPAVAVFVSKMNGSFDDARDIFHDAMIIYKERMGDASFSPLSSEAYLVGIAKHLWLRKRRHDQRLVTLTDYEQTIELPDDFFPTPQTQSVYNVLSRAGKRCLEILRAFYFDRNPMIELAGRLGYRTVHSATVQKFKCIEKLRSFVKEKSLKYEDFMESDPIDR